MIKRFNSDFAHPEGWVGRLVGMILAWKNRERNAWAISLLEIQPNDHVLEIGFGPGQAIQEVAKLTPYCRERHWYNVSRRRISAFSDYGVPHNKVNLNYIARHTK